MAQPYGEAVQYSHKGPIQFQDFSLRFLGARRVKLDPYPRGFTYLDFEVTDDTKKTVVSWTSGTGEIAPAEFEIKGKKMVMEIGLSELRKLQSGQLVIWEKTEFLKRLQGLRGR